MTGDENDDIRLESDAQSFLVSCSCWYGSKYLLIYKYKYKNHQIQIQRRTWLTCIGRFALLAASTEADEVPTSPPNRLVSHCNRPRQRLNIREYWLSLTNTETAAATPPTVMQNLLRASAQWLVLESAVFWLISPPTWVNWHMKMFLVHFTHYSGAERGNFVRNLWILSYILSLKFGEALLLVRTEYWTNESFAPNLRSLWHIPQIWGEAPIGWILCADQ